MVFIYIAVLIVSLLFVYFIQLGPLYLASTDDRLKSMIEVANPQKNQKIIDLGCGEGKVIIALAKRGYTVVGIDVNPILLKKCKSNVEKLHLENKITLKRKNFWNYDLKEYDLIFIFGVTHIMGRLEKKLLAELKPGAQVVSNYFTFPTWKPLKSENHIHLYQKPNPTT